MCLKLLHLTKDDMNVFEYRDKAITCNSDKTKHWLGINTFKDLLDNHFKGIRFTIDNKLVNVKGLSTDEPSGGHMLIRRKCFEDCKGIPQSYAYDAVIKVRAKLIGWKNKRFEDNMATEARDVGSAEGYFKGFLHTGRISHYLNFHPVHVFAWGILKCLRKPYYGGIVYITGYLCSLIKRNEQIDDIRIKEYYWNKWKNIYKQRLFTRVKYEVVE